MRGCAARPSFASATSAGCATSPSRSAMPAAPRRCSPRCAAAWRMPPHWCANTCAGRWRRTPRALGRRSLTDPPLEPGLDGLVPLDGVLRLEHPVSLVRKVEKLAGNAAPLQRREGGDALLERHAEILAPVDD